MIFTEEPAGFNKKFDVVGCYLEHGGKFLLLHRVSSKPSGGMWGLPAGKVEKGETIKDALKREVEEETGICIDTNKIEKMDTVWVQNEGVDFCFYSGAVTLGEKPEITLRPEEHKNYKWVTPEESFKMPLMHDAEACFVRHYFPHQNLSSSVNRNTS